MANEVTNALLTSNGGRVAAVLGGMVLEQIWDPTDLRSLMRFVPSILDGSGTMSIPMDAVPAAAAAATTEILGGASNTAYTTANRNFTPTRYLLLYQGTDLMGLTAPRNGMPINLDHIVQRLMLSLGLTLTDLLCAAFANIANSVGTTSVDLTVDDVYDAMFQINLYPSPGGKACVLYTQQINDLRSDLRSEVGAMQWQDPTAEMLSIKGPGYQGMWNNVQFYQSDSVATANGGADSDGCMFHIERAFAYTLADLGALIGTHIDPADILLYAQFLFVERIRDAANGMTSPMLNFYPAIVEINDTAAVRVITDR